jgi:glycosyltransferase involved in cell wall biosynthesis
MNAPTISVIIPVYNEERTIPSLLEIFRTWGKAAEIIVINDGSTDNTLPAIAQFRSSVTILSRKKNRGKGYSMAEGVRASKGELLLFFDGDVVGLTHKDLDYLIAPVVRGYADMVIGITNCWSMGSVEPYNSINGERILWRKNIIKDVSKFHGVGKGVEFVINDLHKKKRTKMIRLPHVYILGKMEKVPIPEAMLQYVKEAGQFLRAIAQIQTDELTPQAKRVFRVAQSYVQKALDYFQ